MATELKQLQSWFGTSAAWAAANPLLEAGQHGFDITLGKEKIGDGVQFWNDLSWHAVTPLEMEAALNALGHTDVGGNLIVPQGSVIRMTSPNGTLYAVSISNTGVVAGVPVTPTDPLPGGGGDTGGGTTPPPDDNANLVTSNIAGNPSIVLNGTNAAREADQLIRYTRTATQTVTPTNQFGTEATVNSTTGAVTAIVDRNELSQTTGTPIPAGHYVLSGHGWSGGGTAAQWLLTNAQPTRVLTLSTDDPPDPPPPPPDPPAGTGVLPSRVVSAWHHAWSGPQPFTGYPSTVRTPAIGTGARVDLIVLGLAQSGGSGTGNLAYYNRFGAGLASSIATAKAAGTHVVMGFGGSSDGGITITNNTQADQAYNSMVGFVNSYGVTGIDIDLEPSGSTWTEAPLVRLCTRLRTTYGPGFIIGITPSLYGEHTAKWLSFARALNGAYDYMAPMLYDIPEANNPSVYPAVCVNKCDVMLAGGVPANKMILGFMMKPPAETYPNASSQVSYTTAAWTAVKAKYPTIRGGFIWEDKIMAARSWDWVLTAGPVIHQ